MPIEAFSVASFLENETFWEWKLFPEIKYQFPYVLSNGNKWLNNLAQTIWDQISSTHLYTKIGTQASVSEIFEQP